MFLLKTLNWASILPSKNVLSNSAVFFFKIQTVTKEGSAIDPLHGCIFHLWKYEPRKTSAESGSIYMIFFQEISSSCSSRDVEVGFKKIPVLKPELLRCKILQFFQPEIFPVDSVKLVLIAPAKIWHPIFVRKPFSPLNWYKYLLFPQQFPPGCSSEHLKITFEHTSPKVFAQSLQSSLIS